MTDGEICQHNVTDINGTVHTCGQVHNPKKCSGHANIRDDDNKAWDGTTRPLLGIRPCGQPRMRGQRVCKMHGGRAPQNQAKAAERVEQEKAEKILAKAVVTYGLPVDTDPVEALLDEVRWTAGHVAWLRERVQELEQQALIWGRTKTDDQQATEFPGVNTTEQAVPNVWLELYSRERKHLVDVCKAAIAAKIDERRVRLAEQQGEILISVIQAILGDLNLTPEQKAKVPEIVPHHLRLIAGGQTA